MKAALKQAFDAEMAAAQDHFKMGRLDQAVYHVEIAHVLGQRYIVPHTRTHWILLKIGFKRRSPGECIGQILRIMIGIIGSAIGIVPVGNTGGANVSMFRRLPIDPTIRHLLD